MRMAALLAGMLIVGECWAQGAPQTPSADEIVAKTKAAFRTAKNAEEIASIKMWCTDNIASLSFRQRDALMVQALGLMKVDKIDEANVLLKRVASLEELDKTMSTLVCKPD